MPDLASVKRLVVKVGSALMLDAEGDVRTAWLEGLAEDIAALKAQGIAVLVVTSGAAGMGRKRMGLPAKALKLEEKQAAAAVGQPLIMQAWNAAFARVGLSAAQLLLTLDDSENRRRYLNARNTLETLLEAHVVPVVNENDTVATAELRVGDNDRLSARVAQMALADALVLLSDIDGLYTADPRLQPDACHIPEIQGITPEIEAMAGGSGSNVGTGGMVTKLAAAKIALAAGCHMAVADGRQAHPLARLFNHTARASWFLASSSPLTARKHWITGALHATGAVTVDDGAVRALRSGKSLLPAGVTRVTGNFERGDTVRIHDAAGRLVGKGITAYASTDAERIAGRKSQEIEEILGFKGRDTLVHRDDLVLEL